MKKDRQKYVGRHMRGGERTGAWMQTLQGIATVALACAVEVSRTFVCDMLYYQPSEQEARIAAAVDAAYNVQGTKVVCGTREHIDQLRPDIMEQPGTMASAVGVPYTKTLWLMRGTCNNLDSVRSLYDDPDDFDRTSAPSVLNSTSLAAHEVGHSWYNVTNESQAECIAAQTAPDLMVALGMAAQNHSKAAHEMIKLRQEEHALAYTPQQYYYDLRACRPGGVHDVTGRSAVYFPTAY